MGIKGLPKFMRERGFVQYKHLSEFRNCKIAVDVTAYIYKYKYTCEDNWMKVFVESFISVFKKFNIHLNIVFDGKPPLEKASVLDSRSAGKDEQKALVDSLQVHFEKYEKNQSYTCDELEVIFEKIRSSKDRIPTIFSKKVSVEEVRNYIERKSKSIINITPGEISTLKNVLTELGVKWVQALNEAESTACFLLHNGQVEYVLSEDSDALAYDVDRVLTLFNRQAENVGFVDKTEMMYTLGLDKKSFLDFCILCGCDFNCPIKGVAIMTALKNMKQFGSLEKMFEDRGKDEDVLLLNYPRCREIFNTWGDLNEVERYDKVKDARSETGYWLVHSDDSKLKNVKCKYGINLDYKIWKYAEPTLEEEGKQYIDEEEEEDGSIARELVEEKLNKTEKTSLGFIPFPFHRFGCGPNVNPNAM